MMWCVGILVMHCMATDPAPVTAGATFCQVAKPINWTAADTRQTKEQADRHNRIGKKLCGWGTAK